MVFIILYYVVEAAWKMYSKQLDLDKNVDFGTKVWHIVLQKFVPFLCDLARMVFGTVAISGMYGDILTKLFNARISYYDLNTREKVAGYLTNDIENIDKTICDSLELVIQPFVTAFITISSATWVSPLLGPIALLVSAVNYYYSARIHNFNIELGRLENFLNRKIRLHKEQMRGGYAMIRAFNRQDAILAMNK